MPAALSARVPRAPRRRWSSLSIASRIALRARLDAKPDFLGTCGRERRDDGGCIRSARHWIVNGMRASRARDLRAKDSIQRRRQAEDVVGEPDVIGPHLGLEAAELFGDALRRTLDVAPPEDRLRAPVAAEGAAARGHHVPRKQTVRRDPRAAVALNVDEVPRRQRKRVESAG